MTKVTGAVKGVNLTLLDRVHAVGEALGVDIVSRGGFRLRADQERLYAARLRYLAWVEAGKPEPPVLFQATAAKPGQSWHEFRGALDAFPVGTTMRAHEALCREHGLILPVPSEHWHTQRADLSGDAGKATAMTGELYYAGDPAPYPPALGDRRLAQGSTGPDVEKMQELIGATADRQFGPATARTLTAVQTLNGLAPTGVADQATFAILTRPRVSVAGLDVASLDDDGTPLRNLAASRVLLLP